MAKSKEDALAERVERLEKLVVSLGGRVVEERRDPTQNPDYVAFGSPQHAAFKGIVEVRPGEEVHPDEVVYESTLTHRKFRLLDPLTPFMTSADPVKTARLLLQSKVSDLEAGTPEPPANAPPMWTPPDLPHLYD